MDWQPQLIQLYLFIDQQYESNIRWICERESPNKCPSFCDREVLTIYLWGLMQGNTTKKQIHSMTEQHLAEWFPLLPRYGQFVARLNALSGALVPLLDWLVEPPNGEEPSHYVMDSMPIVLVQSTRTRKAQWGADWSKRGYCATKKSFFYGLKLHALALQRPKQLPALQGVYFTPAHVADVKVLQEIAPCLQQCFLDADRAYCDQTLKAQLQKQGGDLQTPIKRKPKAPPLTDKQKTYSKNISKRRQPIEALFAWIQQKTHIQEASLVRSLQGLLIHLLGRLTVTMYLLKVQS